MERAADDMDKWEKKKTKSIEKARGIKDRAKVWDDINGESGRVVKKGKGAFAALEEDEVDEKGRSVWVDVKEGDAEMDEGAGADAPVYHSGDSGLVAEPAPAEFWDPQTSCLNFSGVEKDEDL